MPSKQNKLSISIGVEELADVYEVFVTIAKLNNWSLDKVIETAKAKAQKRGKFDKRIVLVD